MKVVIRIGGSIAASPPDPVMIEKYCRLLMNLKEQGHELFVVVGGGSIARQFIGIAKRIGLKEYEQDEIAIMVSRIVARLLSMKLANKTGKSMQIPISIDEAVGLIEKGGIVVMGGLKPGMTTDGVAAMIAERIGADLLVKATDQDGIYDKDPRKNPDAKKIDKLSFDELAQLFTEKRHKAGIHQILDPQTIRIIQAKRVKTIVINGNYPEKIIQAIKGEKVGTVVQ